MKKEKKVKRCEECGLRIRGKNHKDGGHHRQEKSVRKQKKGTIS